MGTAFAWPAAILLGKRMQKSWGGVPLVPIQYSKHDFINVSPGNFARRQFRVFGFGGALAGGFAFAFLTTERDGWRSDKWKNRPDMKPFPHMVRQDPNDLTEQTMKEALYKKHSKQSYKSSNWFRYFFASDADFEIKRNPYRETAHTDVFTIKNPSYTTYSNNFGDHQQ